MILTCNDINKSFITDVILKDVRFQISEKEKVALVGINGAGKSTLFKIIIGELTQDSGEIIIPSSCTIGYLAQNAMLESDLSIYEEVLSAKPEILKMESDLRTLEEEIAKHANKDEALDRLTQQYANMSHQFEVQDGYSYRSRVKGVIKGLGFTEDEFDKEVRVLSGGEKTRLALAKILIKQPDLLLLDEPTNHLDVNAIEWLEGFLKSYNGALFIISHDRYFLDQVVNKVIELENATATVYYGNYSYYSIEKIINRKALEKQYENQQREIARQEEIIKKLKSFNREKSVRQARSREKVLDRMERIEKPAHLNDTMHIQLKPRIESGNDVLSVRHLSKSFEKRTLFDNIDFDIFKGERVALIGGNGTGKSTIFKILTESIIPDSGTVKLGANVHIGYYDQEHSLLVPTNTLVDEISDAHPKMTNTEIRNLLAAFLFTGDDVFKQISSLSGGEKGRLTLAKLMLSEANFLLLDEPTNHLDVVSKEVLEKALYTYEGTLFFISHDRYFINQIATRILELTPTGVRSYPGDYDYYIEKRAEQAAVIASEFNSNNENNNKALWLQKKEEEAKKRKLRKQLETIENDITQIEERIQAIDESLCDEAVYTDHVKASELSMEKEHLEAQLLSLYEQWEQLQG